MGDHKRMPPAHSREDWRSNGNQADDAKNRFCSEYNLFFRESQSVNIHGKEQIAKDIVLNFRENSKMMEWNGSK